MGLIRLTGFTGAWPARDPKALPDNAAAVATNIRSDGGAYLKGHHGHAVIKALAPATNFVYRIPLPGVDSFANSFWWEHADPDTDVLPAPIVNDAYERIYWASPSSGMKWAPKANIIAGGATYASGVTAPTAAPAVAVVGGTGTPDGPNETRAYTVTFIDAFGQESQPGPTKEITGLADANYMLTSIPQPVADATRPAITTIRIYRTVTGLSGATDFYKVADIAAGTTFYSDSVTSAIVSGQTQLESTLFAPPPPMDGIAAMPNGVFVGWKDRNLYFSENYRPHAWPAEYALQVDYPIVGIAVLGTSCVVCTRRNPFVVTGLQASSMALNKINTYLPCLKRRSIVASEDAVYWASEEGIAFVAAGAAGVVTRDLITRKQWQAGYAPSEVRAIFLDGVYTGFTTSTGDGFEFQPKDAAGKGVNLLDMTFIAIAAGVDPWSGKAWTIGGDNNLYEWNKPTATPLSYTWRSKPFVYPRPTNFTVFQAFFDDTTGVHPIVRVYVTLRGNDGTVSRSLVYSQVITRSGREYKLPAGFKADTWEVEFMGTTELQEFLMASSVEELRRA